MHTYEVLVGNVGRVHEGSQALEAHRVARQYQANSQAGVGRCAGEPVTILRDGEVVFEYDPPTCDGSEEE